MELQTNIRQDNESGKSRSAKSEVSSSLSATNSNVNSNSITNDTLENKKETDRSRDKKLKNIYNQKTSTKPINTQTSSLKSQAINENQKIKKKVKFKTEFLEIVEIQSFKNMVFEEEVKVRQRNYYNKTGCRCLIF
jgi:hypothetical protein